MDSSFSKQYDNESDFDLGRLLRLILMQSKLIILICVIALLTSYYLYKTSPKTYKISSMLQVYSGSSSNFGSNPQTNFVLGASDFADLDNLISLYYSRSNLINVINELNLNVQSNDLNEGEYIKFKKFKILDDDVAFKSFKAEINDNLFNLVYEDGKTISIKIGDEYIDDKIIIKIDETNITEKNFVIDYYHPDQYYKIFRGQISVAKIGSSSSYFKRDGLLEVSYISQDTKEAKKIVNAANELFIKNNIESETERARKAIRFIDNQIITIKSLLDSNKTKLKIFQEENRSVNVDLEIKSILENISANEESINKTNIEIAEASNLYTADNPFYLNLIQKKEELLKQKKVTEEKISSLPLAQQNFIDLYREVEISQDLYGELMNKKLTYSILEASTIGNIRIVDNSYVSSLVSPNKISIPVYTLIAFIFAIIIALIRGIFFIPITNPAEILDENIELPILGVFPDVDESHQFDQSLESSVINIQTLFKNNNKKCKKILVSSPTAANGKSLLSRKLALKLSRLGYKTLLLDLDLKRGNQHNEFNINKISDNEFYSIDMVNIEKFNFEENLYVIPKITNLKDSFHFLYSNKFDDQLSMLAENFDFIIFDTAPLLGASDTSILLSMSDINILVVRHDVTKVNEIKQALVVSDQTAHSIDGIIYNAYKRPSSYYGYYGLYGNYAYQYYAKKYLYEKYNYEKD